MNINVKFSDELLNQEFTFETSKHMVLSYHTNPVTIEFEMFLSYFHSDDTGIVEPKLEDFIRAMSGSSSMNIEFINNDGVIIKSIRGNIREYVFRSQVNLNTNKMEPREQITFTIFK